MFDNVGYIQSGAAAVVTLAPHLFTRHTTVLLLASFSLLASSCLCQVSVALPMLRFLSLAVSRSLKSHTMLL